MSDLNKAPNDFFNNWNKIDSMTYRNVIELHVKRSSEKKVLALIQFELDQFSENVQKDLTISETSTFYQELSNLFKEDSNGLVLSTENVLHLSKSGKVDLHVVGFFIFPATLCFTAVEPPLTKGNKILVPNSFVSA